MKPKIPPIPYSINLEQAFEVVITLFKEEQDRNEEAIKLIEWISSHDANAWEYKNMAKKFLEERKKS